MPERDIDLVRAEQAARNAQRQQRRALQIHGQGERERATHDIDLVRAREAALRAERQRQLLAWAAYRAAEVAEYGDPSVRLPPRDDNTNLEVPPEFTYQDNWQDVIDNATPTAETETFLWDVDDTTDVDSILAAIQARGIETSFEGDELWWQPDALTADENESGIYDYLGSFIDPRLPEGVTWSALNAGGSDDQPGIVAQLLLGRFDTGDFRTWHASLDQAVASFFAEANEEEEEAREPSIPPMLFPFETAGGIALLPFMGSHSEQQNDINRPLTADEEAVVTTAISAINPLAGAILDFLASTRDAIRGIQRGDAEQAHLDFGLGVVGFGAELLGDFNPFEGRRGVQTRSQDAFRGALIREYEEMGLELPGEDFHAHHIVPRLTIRNLSQPARTILEQVDININDTINGVLVPSDIHKGITTPEYNRIINELIREAGVGGEEGVRTMLGAIANEINQAGMNFVQQTSIIDDISDVRRFEIRDEITSNLLTELKLLLESN